MKEPVLTSKIMHRPVVQLQVTFPLIQTLSLQLMQSSIGDQLAVNKKVLVGSVQSLMKEAIAPAYGTKCHKCGSRNHFKVPCLF